MHIQHEAAKVGLQNLRVITADMNTFEPAVRFDRVVSVEMFEHMTNWRELLARIRTWLAPEGALFLHIFCHRSGCYLFDHAKSEDWIAQHFFAGGVMPSHDLIREYADLFRVEQAWRWSGRHYQRTALDWLDRLQQPQRHQGHLARSLRQRRRTLDAPLALVLPCDRRAVRICGWPRMGRQSLSP
jgi:cyclopropane-fatty-acyl-phospholipid synthase